MVRADGKNLPKTGARVSTDGRFPAKFPEKLGTGLDRGPPFRKVKAKESHRLETKIPFRLHQICGDDIKTVVQE